MMGRVRVYPSKLLLSEDVGSGRSDVRVGLLPSDQRIADRFDDLLGLANRAHIRGYHALADAYIERIVAELHPDAAA